jgi:two-component system KDP operon response regulator KdpE
MQGKKILIIEDDTNLHKLVEFALTKAGAQTYTAVDGQAGLRLFYEHRPDLVILDIMMPGLDGWQVCKQIQNLANIPIILMTSLAEEKQIIKGLDCAVDYVTKPFSVDVLVARVRAALRQAEQSGVAEKPTTYGDDYLSINLNERRVLVRGEPVKLSATEYKLLAYLFENANRVLTFEQILENVWGWEYRDSVDYVHVYVSHLRRKLEENPKQPRYLLTEHGVGYRFEKQLG